MIKKIMQPEHPWFIDGFISSFDLLALGSVRIVPAPKPGPEIDKDSLKQDWRNVGRDIQGAINSYEAQLENF